MANPLTPNTPAGPKKSLDHGSSVKAFQQYPPGSPLNPVSRDELRKKFKKLAGAVMPGNRIEEIIAMVERIDQVDDAAKIVPLLIQSQKS